MAPSTRFAFLGRWSEFLLVLVVSATAVAALTYPWVFRLSHVGRVDSIDGRFSIWNVAWVARTLVVDPVHVFDANIFSPRTGTLWYSETNLGAGVLAIPVYWATRNPYFAHNSAVLIAFTLCATGMYYLARYLTRDRRAAAIAAMCFAFCPFVFARTTQVQLLMTFGVPWSMLAFHRMADRSTPGRAAVLGIAMAVQTVFCAYYGVFVVLMIGFAILVVAATRQRWIDARYWTAVAVAAGVAIVLILPLYIPYFRMQRATGFARPLWEAQVWSADWRGYLASSARAHLWMLARITHWKDVDFPGFVATAFGVAGACVAWRAAGRARELAVLYGGLAGLSLWASFGPDARLYEVLYRTLPVFTFMRAPSRFALLVVFGLSILAAVAVRALLARVRWPMVVFALLALVTAGELAVDLDFPEPAQVNPAYDVLATRPRAPIIEMPFFQKEHLIQQTFYMLNSTAHWMPLVNGFSDYIPAGFVDEAAILARFPAPGTFPLVRRHAVRYAIFHMDLYDPTDRQAVESQLETVAPRLHLLYVDTKTRLYEIVGTGTDPAP